MYHIDTIYWVSITERLPVPFEAHRRPDPEKRAIREIGNGPPLAAVASAHMLGNILQIRGKYARRPVSRVLSPLSRGMAIHLGRPSPDASRDLPGRRRENPPRGRSPGAAPIWSCSRWGLPCHRRYRRRGALLPHPFTLTRLRPGGLRRAVCFLWHFPWGRPRRALPGTVFPWSPDFPPPARVAREATIRPSGISKGGGARPRRQGIECSPLTWILPGPSIWKKLQLVLAPTAAIRAVVSPSSRPSIQPGR